MIVGAGCKHVFTSCTEKTTAVGTAALNAATCSATLQAAMQSGATAFHCPASLLCSRYVPCHGSTNMSVFSQSCTRALLPCFELPVYKRMPSIAIYRSPTLRML
jgi:hypothetical protein